MYKFCDSNTILEQCWYGCFAWLNVSLMYGAVRKSFAGQHKCKSDCICSVLLHQFYFIFMYSFHYDFINKREIKLVSKLKTHKKNKQRREKFVHNKKLITCWIGLPGITQHFLKVLNFFENFCGMCYIFSCNLPSNVPVKSKLQHLSLGIPRAFDAQEGWHLITTDRGWPIWLLVSISCYEWCWFYIGW